MAVTRSSKKQTKIEDFPTKDVKKKPADSGKKGREAKPQTQEDSRSKSSANESKKRKASAAEKSPPHKKAAKMSSKQQHLDSKDDSMSLSDPIMINRSPVLQLWGACVAHFLHSDLSWESCLSIGFTISALCAVSKGRAIGMIEPKEEEDEEKQEKKERAKSGAEYYEVMGFNLPLKDGIAVMSGQKKPLKEDNLKSKFGDENYEETKKTMTEALQTWKGEEDELSGKAFHMYEKFRPNVAHGQQGWGRKGELDLNEVASVIKQK